MPLLELRHVTRRFAGIAAVDDLSLAVEPGEFFTLVGPSGCGKTTLLRMVAGFDLPDAGTILLDGQDIAATPPERRPIHTVFQSYALFPHMTVANNVAFPLRMARKPREEIARRVRDALDQVHLADKGNRYPDELSGGQKQRVALARGLVNRPRLLLLDEPLGALDAKLRSEMELELIALQRDVGITFVFVTHAQPEALALSRRIAVMNSGRVEQIGTPGEIYDAPRNRFVAGFIGHCNFFEVTVLENGPAGSRLTAAGTGTIHAPALPPRVAAGDRGGLALRPEQITLTPPDCQTESPNHFQGIVRDTLYVGETTTYLVELPGGARVRALVANSTPGGARRLAFGQSIGVAWSGEAGVYLDA